MIRATVTVAVLILFSLGALISRQWAEGDQLAQPPGAQSEAYLLPRPGALSALAMGHNEMMADLVWLKSLTYFAEHFVLDRDYRWLDEHIETMIALDPNFRMVYQWAGVVVMYGGQLIDNNAVMTSNRFLERGLERFPDDWTLNFMLGCNYRYELQPTTPDEDHEWHLLGSTYLARAADQPEAPPWLRLTARRNLAAAGEGQEALLIDRMAFLTPLGQVAATLAGEAQLYLHNPRFGNRPELQLGTLVGPGLSLRLHLPSTAFWHLLDHRRRAYGDTDSASGYLPLPLRLIVRGETDRRVASVAWTPIDGPFYPTLSLMQ